MATRTKTKARETVKVPGTTRRVPAPIPTDNRHLRIEMVYVDIASIVPYEFNPRDNAAAIESVANSIKAFGFRVPVVLDDDNVLVCGHTRVEAAKTLQLTDVPAIYANDLTPEQINAFRLIDNKVAEAAKWDFDLLSGEIQKLTDSGINFEEFGWNREELDCLTDVVAGDCLSEEGLVSLEERERIQRTEKRAPATARFVLGELVFFIQASDYKRWVDAVRNTHDFREEDIIADIKQRLGITEQSVQAAERVTRRRRTPV